MTRAMVWVFPDPRNAEQGLGLHPGVEARGELLYGLRLVAGRLVFAVYPEPVPRRVLRYRPGSFVGLKRPLLEHTSIILRTRLFLGHRDVLDDSGGVSLVVEGDVLADVEAFVGDPGVHVSFP